MIRKSDVQWWLLEVKNHPESAPTIIEKLARRLIELDAENERLRNEVIRLESRGAAPATTTSRTEVAALKRRVETLESLLEGAEKSEASLVFLSAKGHAARLPFSVARQMARQGRPALEKRALLSLRHLLLVRPHEKLLLLTNRGHGFERSLPDLPALDESGNWPEMAEGLFAPDERLTAAIAVGEPPRFWTLVTRRGYVQRFVRVAFDRRRTQGKPLIHSPLHNDVPAALVRGDGGDLLAITRWGQEMRFSHRAIEGQGAVALELERDDEVMAALSLPQDREIAVCTANGSAVRHHTESFPARSRPGGAGRRLIQAHDVLAAFPYDPEAQLLALTYSGKLLFIPVADLPLQERATRGTSLRDLSLDPALAMTCVAQTPSGR
jgi:DNA gyrase/topoisomerase IV subunit A